MLAVPAAAQAATYTVKAGDGPCGGADLACGELADAATAAGAGDVFNVTPGTYGSATFTVGGVTIAGTAAGVAVNGALVFSGATGGVSKLRTLVISTVTGSGPSVSVTGPAGLEISDAIILNGSGDGVQIHEGAANKIVRSTVATGGQATAAVHVLSADASSAAKALTMESSLVVGGNAGVSVNTGVTALASTAGGVTLTLRHVTSAGAAHGLVLDSTKAVAAPLATGVGSIVANVTDSIIQNGTLKTPYTGLPPLLNPNTITDTYTRTLMGAFDANAVFVDPARNKFHLKAGSPAINQGGFTAGESTTDIDGQDRSAAPTDQGADEYVAPPPPPPPPAGPPPPPPNGDGTAPAIVITKPKQNEKVKLFTITTKTVTVTKNGKKVKVKRTTTKRNKIRFAGTAKDPSGIRGVILTVERLSDAGTSGSGTATAATSKCKWLNATKGLVVKSCAKPILLLANTAKDGSWTFNVKSTIHLGAGVYRILVAGVDNSGARGNSATRADAIHRFRLVKK